MTLQRLLGTARTLLRPMLGFAILLLIGNVVNFNAIGDILSRALPGYLAVVVVLITLDRLMMAIKWYVLLRAKCEHIPLSDAVKSYYIGSFFGAFLPATVGVDVTRAIHLGRYRQYMPTILSSIVVERMIGFVVLAMFSLFAVVVAVTSMHRDLTTLVMLNVGIIAAAGLTLALSFYRPLHKMVFNIVNRLVPRLKNHNSVSKMKDAYQAFQDYRRSPGVLVLFTVLTIIETCIPIVMNYFAALALQLPVGFVHMAVIIPITLFVLRMPFIPSFIGVSEGTFVVLFELANITAPQAFSLSALGTFITLLAVSPGFLFYLAYPHAKRAPIEPQKLNPRSIGSESIGSELP